MEIIRILLGYIWPKGKRGFKVRIVLALICLILAKLCSVYLPIVYKQLVDHFSDKALVMVLPVALITSYGAVKISQSLFKELRDLLFVRVTQSTRRSVALEVFQHLHSLPLQFHLDRQTGGLSRVIERGTGAIRFVMSFLIFNIGPTLFELALVVFAMSYLLDVSFALIIVVTVALYIALTVSVTEWRLKYRREMNKQDNQANTKAIDSLLNFETVKYFGNERFEFDRYDQSLKFYENAAVKSQGSLLVLNAGQQLIIGLGTIAILVLAAKGVTEGRYTVGDFVMVNTYMLQLFIPLNFLGFVYREIKQSLLDMGRMFGILEEVSSIKDTPDAKSLEIQHGSIEFKAVSFGYSSDRKIIEDFTLTIPEGKTFAIVGASGGGKSTLFRLLMRFYDSDSGEILVDGISIKSMTIASLRAALGVVPQDTVLFNDTLGFNIRYGDPSKSEEKVREAIRAAQLEEFIARLPKGLDTTVGERGLKLSGGEKQRVAIARAILRDPKILILDEATSSLDSKTETVIQSALNQLMKHRTSLVIAHRLSTIVDADQIIVLKDGKIFEQGTHQELISQKGLYQDLWEQQRQEQD
ncbi:MAG: ABC transporter ATP-binding protein/permease [Pseudobacteriovorax sp.]|nr:ABC transporter ATP-binding protein/permease [Pseudobacteriovorax sp.]